jgi:hypothetical protein
MSKRLTLPPIPKPPVVKRGPKLYQYGKEQQHTGGPGDPPPGFVTVKTTATEWPVYWGLARIFGRPSADKVRQGPFLGGPPVWEYQSYLDLGGIKQSNFDFVVWQPNPYGSPVAIRIQTEFIHSFTNNTKHKYDVLHRNRAEENFDVVDIFDYLFLGDESGQSIIQLLKYALQLIEPPNPIYAHTVQRVRS